MIKQILSIFRPWFWMFSIIPGLVGFWRANGGLDLRLALVILLLAICSAIAEVVNHYADYEQDKAQKEKYLGPILLAGGSSSGGKMFTRTKSIILFLVVLGVIYFYIGVFLSRNIWYFGLLVLALLMAIFYSIKPIRLKERGFWGLFNIAIGRGIVSFHVGWFLVANVSVYSIFAGLTLTLLFFGTAMIAHLVDYKEDKEAGIKTFPVQVGYKNALLACMVALVSAWLLMLAVFIIGTKTYDDFSLYRVVFVSFGTLLFAIVFEVAYRNWSKSERETVIFQIIGAGLALFIPFVFL